MATLSLEYKEFLCSLADDEQEKYWLYFADDLDTKTTCEQAGEEWDPEIESAALRYLRNIRRRKEVSSRQRQTSESSDVPQDVASNHSNCKLNIGQHRRDANVERSNSDFEKASASRLRFNLVSDREHDFSEEDNESQDNHRIGSSEYGDDDKSDSEVEEELYENCVSVTSNVKKTINKEMLSAASATTASLSNETAIVKKFPVSSFREVSSLNEGGVFRKVSIGHIRGRLVKVKTFHAPLKGIRLHSEKLDSIRKIFQLDHRNLIPMLGMIDVGIKECPQLVYASEPNDFSLLKYLHDKDESNPKGYATFGKFSLDIIGACMYLHKSGVVHGYLSASSVTVRRAYRSYGNKERKLHLNLFLSDYGIIQLTDGDGKMNLFKASNGKIVPLRWVPKEILCKSSEAVNSNYSFESDIWSFGVVLWEMWTNGEVPYGKSRSNLKVEQDILQDCHPLTFNKPLTCPQHVLDVMKSIFQPAQERPTFLELYQTFDEFRKHRYEHGPKEKAKSNSYKSVSKDEERASSSGSTHSTAITRYQRVREWKNSTAYGKQLKPQRQPQNHDLLNKLGCNRGHGKRGNAKFKHSKNVKKAKMALVCPLFLPSDDNMVTGISQFQNQVGLAQAIVAMNMASRQVTSGPNNVNVNIDNQRSSREQSTHVHSRLGFGRGRHYYKGKSNKS